MAESSAVADDSDKNATTKGEKVEQRSKNSIQRDSGRLPVPDSSHILRDQSKTTPVFLTLRTDPQQTLTVLGSQPTAGASTEVKNASQLTFENWKYIFETCNLSRALFIDELKPTYSFESAIQLKENMKPKIIVNDSSTVDAYLTYTERSKSFVENKFTEIDSSFSCPFVSMSSSYNQNEKMARTCLKKKLFTTCMWNIPRVNIKLDSYSVEPTSKFLFEVDGILSLSSEDQYDKFVELFSRYGHKLATELIIGGQLYHTDMQEKEGSVDETQHVEERKHEFTAAVKEVPVATDGGMEVGVGAGMGRRDEVRSRYENDRQKMNVTFQTTGGNTTLCRDPGKWVSTVEDFHNWRVIKIIKTVPVYEILDRERRRQIKSVLSRQQTKINSLNNTNICVTIQPSTDETSSRTIWAQPAITGVAIVSSPTKTPMGYHCIKKVYDVPNADAALTAYKFSERLDCFLCIRRVYPSADGPTLVLEDIDLMRECDTPRPNYRALSFTIDTYIGAFPYMNKYKRARTKKTVCIKMVQWQLGMEGISDIVFLDCPELRPANYKIIGEIDGLQMCVRRSSIIPIPESLGSVSKEDFLS